MIPLRCNKKFRSRNILHDSSIALRPLMQGLMLLFVARALVQARPLILLQILALSPTLALALILIPLEAAVRLKLAESPLTQRRGCLRRFGMLLLNQNTTIQLDCRKKFHM